MHAPIVKLVGAYDSVEWEIDEGKRREGGVGQLRSEESVVNVGKQKNQLLDEDRYEEVSDVIRPYLGQLI
jgi:predicted SPOUT superfamily RNA methylase MTH1